MRKKLYATLMLTLVVVVSVGVMIVPTFFTKGVSRVVLHKELNLPLILDDEKDIKLLFFGYSGCADICTPRLSTIDEFYKTLDKKTRKRVGVEFLDISVPLEKDLPQRFAEFFNPDFKGIYLSNDVLRVYTRAFNVYFSKSLIDKTEYDHTTNIYLLKKTKNKKELRYIYNSYPYDFKQINLDIKELLNE